MFTGIVERMGRVVSSEMTASGRRIVVEAPGLGEVPTGASIAVNGVCLTAVEPSGDTLTLDVIPETLTRTNIGLLMSGEMVNLERPMRADGRFDGHIVQGHVDGTGEISALESGPEGEVVMRISTTSDLLRYIVDKGSITIDGVSLTVVSVDGGAFTVALIPHTLEITTLGLRNVGDTVNLEVDVLAKYVERLTGTQS
ncbi:MAG: riboflavin synthase [Acidimicrobiia bacterium]